MNILERKHDELTTYVRRLARRWNVSNDRLDDVVQDTMLRLVQEHSQNPFKSSKTLWGRATNIAKEAIAALFASSLPLSGVGFQAHNAARRYLAQHDNDPYKAYANQNRSDKVSRELLQIVAGGSGLYDPTREPAEVSQRAYEASYSLTEQDEDTIKTAINTLPTLEADVVRAYVWGDGERLTMRQVAQRLGISEDEAKRAWSRAKRRLATELVHLHVVSK